VVRVPLPASEMPKVTWSVPAGTAGVVPLACAQALEAGRVARSAQYVQPAAEWRKTVRELAVPVDLYQALSLYVAPGVTAGAQAVLSDATNVVHKAGPLYEYLIVIDERAAAHRAKF
jgi:hypothetical protein